VISNAIAYLPYLNGTKTNNTVWGNKNILYIMIFIFKNDNDFFNDLFQYLFELILFLFYSLLLLFIFFYFQYLILMKHLYLVIQKC
jgi:hypothetical protein